MEKFLFKAVYSPQKPDQLAVVLNEYGSSLKTITHYTEQDDPNKLLAEVDYRLYYNVSSMSNDTRMIRKCKT